MSRPGRARCHNAVAVLGTRTRGWCAARPRAKCARSRWEERAGANSKQGVKCRWWAEGRSSCGELYEMTCMKR